MTKRKIKKNTQRRHFVKELSPLCVFGPLNERQKWNVLEKTDHLNAYTNLQNSNNPPPYRVLLAKSDIMINSHACRLRFPKPFFGRIRAFPRRFRPRHQLARSLFPALRARALVTTDFARSVGTAHHRYSRCDRCDLKRENKKK